MLIGMGSAARWNHNVQFYRWIVDHVPPACDLVLDVGCGEGLLTGRLARVARSVIGVDISTEMIVQAQSNVGSSNVRFIQGDVLEVALPDGEFGFIAAIAVLHHFQLERGLRGLRDLLRPGGVLAVVGLARRQSVVDYVVSFASLPIAWLGRARRGYWTSAAPVVDPQMSYAEIEKVARAMLPAVEMRRRLFFRYTMVWRKPDG